MSSHPYQLAHDSMLSEQLIGRDIKDPRVIAAFRQIPRHLFVPADLVEYAYEDRPLSIGWGQTISQPYIVAYMLQAARLEPSFKVLDIGTGSGYAAALLGAMVQEVHSIERIAPLVEQAKQNLAKLPTRNITVYTADGSQGLPEQAPFDAILVAARTERIPEALREQLQVGGRLIIPVGPGDVQELVCVERLGPEEFIEKRLEGVRFVPLVEDTLKASENKNEASF